MTTKNLRKYQAKLDTPVIGVVGFMNSTKKEKSSLPTLKALNDIYIIEEEPVETVYDTGVSAIVTEAIKSKKLFIPDAYKDFAEKYPCRGNVIAKGNKCKYDIKVGDKVVYARLGVQRYQHDGKTLCDVRECDLHGIFEPS